MLSLCLFVRVTNKWSSPVIMDIGDMWSDPSWLRLTCHHRGSVPRKKDLRFVCEEPLNQATAIWPDIPLLFSCCGTTLLQISLSEECVFRFSCDSNKYRNTEVVLFNIYILRIDQMTMCNVKCHSVVSQLFIVFSMQIELLVWVLVCEGSSLWCLPS